MDNNKSDIGIFKNIKDFRAFVEQAEKGQDIIEVEGIPGGSREIFSYMGKLYSRRASTEELELTLKFIEDFEREEERYNKRSRLSKLYLRIRHWRQVLKLKRAMEV